jgi:hypothetical protein
MKRLARLLIIVSVVITGGCAELKMTAQVLNIMMLELFRLPVYCLRMPFQLIQGLGPALQAGIRSAANVAPLLLFIENRPKTKENYYAAAPPPGALDEMVRNALGTGVVLPILPLLEEETGAGAPVRFTLVDPRLVSDPRLQEALRDALNEGGARVRCVCVDGTGIFSRPGHFLKLCRKMRERGDAIVALTLANRELALLTRTPIGNAPSTADACPLIPRWNRLLRELDGDAHREG